MARESLDCADHRVANRSYHILRGEMGRVGGRRAGQSDTDMITIDVEPDWRSLARGTAHEAGQDGLGELERQPKRALTAPVPT